MEISIRAGSPAGTRFRYHAPAAMGCRSEQVDNAGGIQNGRVRAK
ncbi:MAG: hypothetical protein ABFS17_05655 [Chloroflexota bacterium]